MHTGVINMNKKAVLLLSGGLDSTTTLVYALNKGYIVSAITFDYGQRHNIEIEKSILTTKKYNIKHLIFPIPLDLIGGSALTDNIDVPEHSLENIGNAIPITYVPARNIIFLSIASAWAEVQNMENIFIGVNMLDYSGYPDCRNIFIKSMEKSLTLGTKLVDLNRKIKIHTPLSDLKKFEIIRLGIDLDVDYSLTSSCYNPDKKGRACGKCDSCKLRLQGFKAIGISDPVPYII